MDSPYLVNFEGNLINATHYMKILSNQHRLKVMCRIVHAPHTVSELVELTGISQPALSLHLAKLREEKMVEAKRDGKQVFYRIANHQLAALVEHICYQFKCWENIT
jgi:ArsR family transcriptional regulator